MKKVLRFLPFVSLFLFSAVLPIALSFNAQDNEKAAVAASPSFIYLSVDDPTWNFGNNNLGGFSYAFYENDWDGLSPNQNYPYGLSTTRKNNKWFEYTFQDCFDNNNCDLYKGLEVSLINGSNGMNVVKIEVPTKSKSCNINARYFVVSSSLSGAAGNNQETDVLSSSLKTEVIDLDSLNTNGLDWVIVTGSNTSGRHSVVYRTFSQSELSKNKIKKVYIDIYNSWWKGNDDIVYDYWVKFRSVAGSDSNSRYGSNSNGLEISSDLSTDFVADVEYGNPNATLTKRYNNKDYKINYACVAIPQFAVALELHDAGGINRDERYSNEYTIPEADTGYNMIMVSGTSSAKQTVTSLEAPFEQVKTIYFKVTGSDWAAYSSSIRAAFYGLSGYNSSKNYIAYSNITQSSAGTLGTIVESGGNTYLAFDVPDYATHVAFNRTNDESGNTSLIMINPNGERTFTYQGGSLSVLSSPNISKTSGSTTPSGNTARLFASNTVYQDYLSTSSVWYGTNLSTDFAIQVWNDDCLGPTGDASGNGSYIYYFSDRFDGGGTDVNGSPTNNCYYYVDIPTNMKYFRLVKMVATGRLSTSNIYFATTNIGELEADAYSYIYSLWNLDYTFHEYAAFDWEEMYFKEGENEFGDYHVGAAFMVSLLNAYDTCSSSEYNGYGNAAALAERLYVNPTDETKTQLVQTIEEASSSKAGIYSPETVDNIITEMINRQNKLNNKSGQNSLWYMERNELLDNYRIYIIIAVSGAAVLSIFIMTLMFRKKRINR